MPTIKICQSCNREFTAYRSRTVTCGKSCAARFGVGTKKAKGSNLGGGLRKGVERSKSGYYSGIYCSSTYELVFLVYHLDHGHLVSRCDLSLPYTYEGRVHQYHPDFEVDGRVYEVKGYLNEQDSFKAQCYPDIILVQNISLYREYVMQKTGLSKKQLVTLYTDRQQFEKICGTCTTVFYNTKKTAQFCSRSCAGKSHIGLALASRKVGDAMSQQDA